MTTRSMTINSIISRMISSRMKWTTWSNGAKTLTMTNISRIGTSKQLVQIPWIRTMIRDFTSMRWDWVNWRWVLHNLTHLGWPPLMDNMGVIRWSSQALKGLMWQIINSIVHRIHLWAWASKEHLAWVWRWVMWVITRALVTNVMSSSHLDSTMIVMNCKL